MKKLIFSLLLLSVLCLNMSAQTRIHGKFSGLPKGLEPTLLLESWYADEYNRVDSAKLMPDSTFAFPARKYEGGLYRLGFKREGHPIEFMVSEADSVLEFRVTYEKLMARQVSPVVSNENKAYSLLRELSNNSDRTIMTYYDAYVKARANNSPDTTKNLERIQSTLAEVGRQAEKIRSDHPGTFTAKYLIPFAWRLDKKGTSSAKIKSEFYEKYVFDFLDFNKAEILRTKNMRDLMAKYATAWFQESSNYRGYADKIMAYAKDNTAVSTYLFRYLLDKFIRERNDDAATYLLNSFNPGCTDDDPMNTGQLIQAMKKCSIGEKVTEMNFEDIPGKFHSLTETYSKSKLTLIVFWRTNCPHCIEEKPKISELYNQYHKLGLEVYSISIDMKRPDWEHYLDTNYSPCTEVWCPRPQFKELMNSYPVTGTPYMLIIDGEGKIKYRMFPSASLDVIIGKELGNP